MSPDSVDELVDGIASRWWSPVIRGVAAILFGVLAIAVPRAGLAMLVILWAIYALVDGVFNLAVSVQRGRAGARWGWPLLEGLVSIAAGVLTFAWPEITAMVLLYVIAVWAIATGVAEMAAAFALRGAGGGEWLLGLAGVSSIGFGFLLAWRPGTGALAVVWLIGGYAMLFGVLLVALGLQLHHWRSGHVGTGAPTVA